MEKNRHSISDLINENIIIMSERDEEVEYNKKISVNYRGITSIIIKNKNPSSFIENKFKVSISLVEIKDDYQIITCPISENIPLIEFSTLEWKIFPLATKFDLIFKVQIKKNIVSQEDHTFHTTDEFSLMKACRAKKPYRWRCIKYWFIKGQHWIVPAILSIIISFITTISIQQWWCHNH